MSLAVLGYQLFIVASLVSVRFGAPKVFLPSCLGWTAFSVVNLFFPPLIVLQLAVVWGTYLLLRPRRHEKVTEGDLKGADAGPKAKHVLRMPAAAERGESRPATPNPTSSPKLTVTDEPPLRVSAPASGPGVQARPVERTPLAVNGALSKASAGMDEFHRKVSFQYALTQAIADAGTAFAVERDWVGHALKHAEFTVEHQRKLDSDPRIARQYELVRASRASADSEVASPPRPSRTASLKTPHHPDPTIDEAVRSKFQRLASAHSDYLTEVAHNLDRDPRLKAAFAEVMVRVGDQDLLGRILAKSDGGGSGGEL